MKGNVKKLLALSLAATMAMTMSSMAAFAEEAEDTAVETVELNVAYMPNYASLWGPY